jgi:hypothetical protein
MEDMLIDRTHHNCRAPDVVDMVIIRKEDVDLSRTPA